MTHDSASIRSKVGTAGRQSARDPGRRLLPKGHVISPAMKDNPVHLLEPMVRDAAFQQIRGGDVRLWLRYMQAVKLGAAP
jgi:hypothetical protein